LRATRTCLGIELDPQQRARMVALGQLLSGESLGRGQPPRMIRLVEPLHAQLTVPGGFASAEIRSLSGRGLALTTARKPAVGHRTVVQVVDPETLCEFTFPARVVWRSPDTGQGLGVAFDGV